MNLEEYKKIFLSHLNKKVQLREPQNLYMPIKYILDLGGKRLRPILTLMACDLFGAESNKALDAALAIEVFHNFTLIHDDIMDNAPIRRGKITVHEKWDSNAAILSGDAMMILASQLFETYESELFKPLVQLFNKTALEVCEGQQYDVDFETRNDVSIPEYLKMITFKTSVLVAAAMKMGALIAEAKNQECDAIYNYGLNLGLAFQLQDDYLDAFGDPETFGKQVGGDIIENKKTMLFLLALESSDSEDRSILEELFTTNPADPTQKITQVKELFTKSGAVLQIQQQMKEYTEKALKEVDQFPVEEEKKEVFRTFALQLMERKL